MPLLSSAYATLYKAQVDVIFEIVGYVRFDIGGYVRLTACDIYEPL